MVAPTVARGRLGEAAAALELGRALVGAARGRYAALTSYTVTVPESDVLYPEVHRWLLALDGGDAPRSLTAVTGRESNEVFATPEDTRVTVPPLLLQFNDRRPRRVRVGGHLVTARVCRLDEDQAAVPHLAASQNYTPRVEKGLVFTARSRAGREAVLRHLVGLNEARSKRPPRLQVVNQWGHWSGRNDLPPRPIESVVLPPGQKEHLVADLERFLLAEADYNRLAVPWHRGYLLHGPPGTGKTSLVKALASHFGLNLWYASLGDLSAEASLINLFSEVGPRSVVLLEDIDTVEITHDRDQAAKASTGRKISLFGLLNALDGVATPHGLVTFMTTNHLDRLDPALTRAGRMDVVEELAMPSWREVATLFERFHGPDHAWRDGDLDAPCPLSQAQVSEILKSNMHDPEASIAALKEAVS